jgi:hypothetical protein
MYGVFGRLRLHSFDLFFYRGPAELALNAQGCGILFLPVGVVNRANAMHIRYLLSTVMGPNCTPCGFSSIGGCVKQG